MIAPTGSGKTLAAFLHALDRLLTTPAAGRATSRCRVLYVSPLKALAVDVDRNLRSPLAGIRHAAARLGVDVGDVDGGDAHRRHPGRAAPRVHAPAGRTS